MYVCDLWDGGMRFWAQLVKLANNPLHSSHFNFPFPIFSHYVWGRNRTSSCWVIGERWQAYRWIVLVGTKENGFLDKNAFLDISPPYMFVLGFWKKIVIFQFCLNFYFLFCFFLLLRKYHGEILLSDRTICHFPSSLSSCLRSIFR